MQIVTITSLASGPPGFVPDLTYPCSPSIMYSSWAFSNTVQPGPGLPLLFFSGKQNPIDAC